MKKNIKVALVGNPNVGKTSIFNALTGLNQHIGNYPGITVERKTGFFELNSGTQVNIVDVPGTYSIRPSSKDEEVAMSILFDPLHKDYPDLVVCVADVCNLKRNLLLYSQIKDLGFKVILVINMIDQMQTNGIWMDAQKLEEQIGTKIVLFSARKKQGIKELKQSIEEYESLNNLPFFDLKSLNNEYFSALEEEISGENPYKVWLGQSEEVQQEGLVKRTFSKPELIKTQQEINRLKHTESVKRSVLIGHKLNEGYKIDKSKATGWNYKLDKVFTHKVFGFLIFFLIILLIFESVFSWATVPQGWIEEGFSWLKDSVAAILPEGVLADLLVNGLLSGLEGVLVFIPQIAVLFLSISILEETGYMSRVVFLMDRVMRPFGLSGKSIIPMISGTACAIPAIMSARNIEDGKERLITMLVTPFVSCSARIPVYLIIIALVIPDEKVWGVGLQSLVMTCMYFLGFFMALIGALAMKYWLKSNRKSFFIIEMPSYKVPILKNVGYTVYEKTKSFVIGAGKIILSLSVLIWFLGSHGPSSTFGNAEEIVMKEHNMAVPQEDLSDEIAAYKLKHSYIGMLGSAVEPVFRPLGYDWKISIAVLTTFAAREVFGGTLGTIYSLGSDLDVEDDETQSTIVEKMKADKRTDGTPLFTLGTGVSLLLYYAFAMQCIATLAITKKETNSWKWAMVQLVFMSGIGYIAGTLAYQFL